jgi:hypothetical protein
MGRVRVPTLLGRPGSLVACCLLVQLTFFVHGFLHILIGWLPSLGLGPALVPTVASLEVKEAYDGLFGPVLVLTSWLVVAFPRFLPLVVFPTCIVGLSIIGIGGLTGTLA